MSHAVNTKESGFLGEQIAARFLEDLGYVILSRNQQCGRFEIDIIAKDIASDCTVFVEVKTSVCNDSVSRTPAFHPVSRVNSAKIKTLQRAAQIYLARELKNLDVCWRIDAVSIIIIRENKKALVSHFKNIA